MVGSLVHELMILVNPADQSANCLRLSCDLTAEPGGLWFLGCSFGAMASAGTGTEILLGSSSCCFSGSSVCDRFFVVDKLVDYKQNE